VAGAYGTALTTLVRLNRSARYDRFHLPLMESEALGRQTNQNLWTMFGAGVT
jgi:hypothetical protein